jgi:glycosyltransferase involved in cell wall biosynthesis
VRWFERNNGISVLIATQNEEAIVALCILSFLEFGDELVVVDNGSTDRTKEIVRDLESMYPKRIKFFDVPGLPDLYHNRQYAFSKSSYRWVARIDADFVAYTENEYDIARFRQVLLSHKRTLVPRIYALPPLPSVTGDFWHTGLEGIPRQRDLPGWYVPPPVTKTGGPRIYEVFPGFRFQRLGRWEGVRFQRVINKLRTESDRPLWMHCNLKSSLSYLYRSERTNWREQGNFARYPSLESYVREILPQKYGTDDIDEAAERYLQENVYPFLQPYDLNKYYPYPRLVREQMERNPIYKIVRSDGVVTREYCGIDPLPYREP